MNVFIYWMDNASADQKRRLAEITGHSAASLRQMAKSYRHDGELRITPDIARKIEAATAVIEAEGGPSMLYREDLSPACGSCEFARQCRES